MSGESGCAALAFRLQFHIETIGRQLPAQSFRPLNQTGGARERVLQAEFPSVVRLLQPVKIDMPEFATFAIIGLNQGVSGAGDFVGVARPSLDGAPRQGGFAGAQIATEANDIARTDLRPKAAAEGERRHRVRQRDSARIGGGLGAQDAKLPFGQRGIKGGLRAERRGSKH